MRRVLFICLCLLLAFVSLALAKKVTKQAKAVNQQEQSISKDAHNLEELMTRGRIITGDEDRPLIIEYTFDTAGNCDPMGWTAHDLTEQTGCYWHIDDFDGLNPPSVIDGDQSLWCGARYDRCNEILNSYLCLPGYGRNWNQGWCFKCIEVPTDRAVYIDYDVVWDSEPGYDITYVEYATGADCASLNDIDYIPYSDWNVLNSYDGAGVLTIPGPAAAVRDIIPAGHDGFIKIRFRFESDGAWDDEDCLWGTDGAIIIDDLTISDDMGTIYDQEDFEDENGSIVPRDTQTSETPPDWECCVISGYGNYAGLYKDSYYDAGSPPVWIDNLVQVDPCWFDASCLWGFFNGSLDDYTPEGAPAQKVVPYENARGQFINNEIWSPFINIAPYQNCASLELEFDVYNDLPLSPLVFYVWHVRCVDLSDPCAPKYGLWLDRNFVYYNQDYCAKIRLDNESNRYEYMRWMTVTKPFDDLICVDCPKPKTCCPPTNHIQIALGVVDMYEYWGIIYGDGLNHSHAPLIDNVKLYCKNSKRPIWTVETKNLFQDTFTDGSGFGRADAATGEDVIEVYVDPNCCTGFYQDAGRDAVYCNIRVTGPNTPMSPSLIEELGVPNCPYRAPTISPINCEDYDRYFMYKDPLISNRYVFDLKDDIFVAGNKIEFFFSATNDCGETSYWSEFTGTTWYPASMPDLDAASVCKPMEFQILPTGESDILYVDHYDGLGAQPYFDWAFDILNITPDRYDVRAPRSFVGNSLAGRVYDIGTQLIPVYRKILWNSGDLCAGNIGDGSGTPILENDFAVLYEFLNEHTSPIGSGIYLSGDDLAEEWMKTPLAAGPFATTYCSFALLPAPIPGDHKSTLYNFAENPTGVGKSGGIFYHFPPDPPEGERDIIHIDDSCPVVNDFDVIGPVGLSVGEMYYDDDDPSRPAVISQSSLNSLANPVGVVLSGFSYHNIRDDQPNCVIDRVDHLIHILRYLGNIVGEPTTEVCMAGKDDDFDTSDGDEPTTVSDEFFLVLDACFGEPLLLFDVLTTDRCFGHTMYCSPCWSSENWDCVLGATLEIRMKANSGQSNNDGFSLREEGVTIWGCGMNNLELSAGGNGNWVFPDVRTFTLDLANLPYEWGGTTNIMENLRDGDLDIMVSDDTGVDYIKLLVERVGGTGIPEGPPRSAFLLHQNYPNPFNPVTTIQFDLPASSPVVLNIFDIGGRLVTTLLNDIRSAGLQRATWDGKNASGELVASGIYFYRLQAGKDIQTRKMLLLK